MDKREVCARIESVCKTLDGGITISDVRSAGNLAGCYAVLQEILTFLNTCEISSPKKETNGDKRT